MSAGMWVAIIERDEKLFVDIGDIGSCNEDEIDEQFVSYAYFL